MANITAQMVKELRDSTGAGMMDCKSALGETNGDMEAAVDWLRKKGLSKAAKKAGRVAAEGLIGIALAGTRGVVVEVNSETDFVARNDLFQGLVKMIAQVALDAGTDVEKIKAAKAGSITVAEAISDTIAKIGENMTLRRAAALSVSQGVVASYVHNSVTDGLGKIGVLVALESAGKTDELAALGRMVAMHVAAANPQAVDSTGLDPALVAREKDVLADKAKASGKPANVIEKIVESGLKTYYKEVCLLDQAYIHRRGQERQPGAEGSGRPRRRADQGHRLRALRARRGYRKAGIGFRRRSSGRRRSRLNSRRLKAIKHAAALRDGAIASWASLATVASSSSSRERRWRAPKVSVSISRPSIVSPTISSPAPSSASSSALSSAAAISFAASMFPRVACRARPATPWACWRR